MTATLTRAEARYVAGLLDSMLRDRQLVNVALAQRIIDKLVAAIRRDGKGPRG